MNRKEFQQLAKNRVLLLDGAAGSNFLLAGMPAGVCSELWLIEHPQALLDLQKAYVKAGTQILYAPTFGGNRFMLEEKHVTMPVEEVNRRIGRTEQGSSPGESPDRRRYDDDRKTADPEWPDVDPRGYRGLQRAGKGVV